MRSPILPIFLFALLLSACGSQAGETDNTDDQAAAQPEATPALSDNEIIMQLSAYLIAEPQTQAEKEQNAIVNHAIDQLIPLERTQSGLFYRILAPGEGEILHWGDYIKTHYEGSFLDGQQFESSIKRNKPLQFYIGNMIPGWNEGLQLVAPQGRIQLFVPSGLGYTDQGLQDGKGGFLVPPDTPTVFEVEVLERLKKAGEE